MVDSPSPLTEALDEANSLDGSGWLMGGLHAATYYNGQHRRAARDWRLQDQIELDLHLTGANVTGHATRADMFGNFVRRSAEAVKELAKDIAGLERHTPGLLIEGAAPGSVRVVLRSPSRQSRDDETEVAPVETLDGKALHQFASIFLLAEVESSGQDDDLLTVAVERLNGRARQALRSVGTAIMDASFDIEGDLAARGHDPQRVVITPGTAARVVKAAGEQEATVDHDRISGEVDGWVWSKSIMQFKPDQGRSFPAVVPPDLQETVAAIVGQPEHRAVGTFLVTKRYPSGDRASEHRSYVLEAIEATVDEVTVDIQLPDTSNRRDPWGNPHPPF